MDHPEYKTQDGSSKDSIRLVLLGGARHQDDLDRVESLRALAKELDIQVLNCVGKLLLFTNPLRQSQVTFVVNAPYPDMLGWLSRSSIGISTMVDEHFGINVVEFMVSSVTSHILWRTVACSPRISMVIRRQVSFPSPMLLEVR